LRRLTVSLGYLRTGAEIQELLIFPEVSNIARFVNAPSEGANEMPWLIALLPPEDQEGLVERQSSALLRKKIGLESS
jgi:hypothetical protein